jgi:hypothetical protein
MWIDNFSKMYRKTTSKIDRKILADALWTGVVLRNYAYDDVSMDVMHLRGFVVPAMPDDPFRLVGDMLQTMSVLTEVNGEMPLLFDDCLFSTWGCNRIPVVPLKDNLPEETLERFERCPSRLTDFYPKGLVKKNCGSNMGLCEVMLEVMKSQGQGQKEPPNKYFAMTADLNIFDRVVKVTYQFLLLYVSLFHISYCDF